MSIWDAGAFDNDDAVDWLSELEDEPSIVALNDAFDELLSLNRDDYLEVTEAARALAAAHVAVAVLDATRQLDDVEGETLDILRGRAVHLDSRARESLARRAMAAVMLAVDSDRSELAQLLFQDADMYRTWREAQDQLLVELKAHAGDPASRGTGA